MTGILFGKKHTFDDWNLILTEKTIGLPSPKTSSVNVEGADGVLDTSEILTGEIKFSNRKLEFNFTMLDKYEDFQDKITEIANYIHGQKLRITLDDDPTHCYVGRCSIDQWASDKRIGRIVIKCDCEPYKYDIAETVVSVNVSGEKLVNIRGKRRTVNPVVKCTKSNDDTLSMTINGYTVELNNGENPIIDFFIKEGNNVIKFMGNGNVILSFTGGEL